MPQQQPAGDLPRAGPTVPWVTVLGATLSMQTVATLATQALPVLAPLVTRGAGLPPEAIGQLYGLTLLGSVLFLVCGGPILARLGPVRTLQLGAGLAVLGLATAAAGPPVALLVAALLVGLGNAPSVPAGSRILAQTAPPEHRTLIFSVKQAGAPLGGMIAGLALPPVALELGWPIALLLVLGALLGSALAIQPLRPTLDATRDSARAVGPAALFAPSNIRAPFAALRLHPLLIPLSLLCFTFALANGSLFALTVSFLVEARGLTLAQAGLAYAALQGAGMTARLVLGWLGDRTGAATRNLLLQAVAASAALALLALVPTGAPIAVFVIAAALAGFFATSWPGIALAELARVSPPDRVADATTGASIVGFLGFSIGPTACAAVVSATSNWSAPLLVIAALLVITATVLAPRLRGDWAEPVGSSAKR